MSKFKKLALALILLLILAGCQTKEQEPLRVYSFHGEDALFSVSNGVIVQSEEQDIFCGGELKTLEGFPEEIAQFTATYYWVNDAEESVITQNQVINQTGDEIKADGDLGKMWGEKGSFLSLNEGWTDQLYFELELVQKDGTAHTYRLRMEVSEVTPADQQ